MQHCLTQQPEMSGAPSPLTRHYNQRDETSFLAIKRKDMDLQFAFAAGNTIGYNVLLADGRCAAMHGVARAVGVTQYNTRQNELSATKKNTPRARDFQCVTG